MNIKYLSKIEVFGRLIKNDDLPQNAYSLGERIIQNSDIMALIGSRSLVCG